MERIIDIIYVIGKQNLAFRGHSNEAAYDLNETGLFQGNFLEIVKLVAKYDPVLFNHLQYCKQASLKRKKMQKGKQKKQKYGHGRSSHDRGNLVTMLSKTTINKIINIVGKLIQTKIADNIKRAGIFSLEVDSTQDVSVLDQLCVCARYVVDGCIQERILRLISLNSSTGEAQYQVIKTELMKLGLDFKNIIG